MSDQTVIFGSDTAVLGRRTESVTVSLGTNEWTISEGQSLTIGRAEDSDITYPHAWVSRQHGKLELRDLQLEFTDHSSAGSSILTADGQEFEVHRRTTLLNGDGRLLFGTRDRTLDASALTYATNDLIPD